MALPYFEEFGWEPLVLHIDPDEQEGLKDPSLMLSVPRRTRTWQAQGIPRSVTEWFGLTSVGWRSLLALNRIGAAIIASERPSAVFFSTTMFGTMLLGPAWRRRFGVPYAVDFQDPWVDDYYDRARVTPPGGWWKYRAVRAIARRLEPRVMRNVSEVVCVSPDYVATLQARYPYLRRDQFTELPFGAPEADFELLRVADVQQRVFRRASGEQHWVYVGRGGADMAPALRVLFNALQRLREKTPQQWRGVQLHFAGTSYAPRGRATETVAPLAREYGLADIITESTDRIPYFEALKTLVDADALLVIGSDSRGYSASKLYPYILARKPMLSILHQNSPAADILRGMCAGEVIGFDPSEPSNATQDTIDALERVHVQAAEKRLPLIDSARFAQYTAREMTKRLCAVFDRAALTAIS